MCFDLLSIANQGLEWADLESTKRLRSVKQTNGTERHPSEGPRRRGLDGTL